jgi:multicomponent Na+:H+ antiporter subunit G
VTAFDWIALPFFGASAVLFLGGALGVLRFPDVHARLHALTKLENVGLGLLLVALALRARSPAVVVKLALIWMLVLLASATASYLVGYRAMAREHHEGPG